MILEKNLWRPRIFSALSLLFCAQLFGSEKILSLGNSLIQFNEQPALIEALAASGRHELKWTHRCQLGQSLQFHWDQGTNLDDAGEPTARNLIRQGGWTHVVLQEYSSWPRENATGFFAAVRLFKSEIQAHCPDAKILLFENWPYSDSAAYTQDMGTLDTNYVTIAAEIGAEIIPVAHAFDLIRQRDGFANVNPYVLTDDKHPSLLGSYLSACVICRMLYPKPRHLLKFYPSGIDPRTARLIQFRARQVMRMKKKLGL